MITILSRNYWYHGLSAYPFFKRNYLKKVSNTNNLRYIADPLDLRQYRGTYDSVTGKSDPIKDLVKRVKHKQNLDITAGSVCFLAYHGAKENVTEPVVWSEIEFYIGKTLSEMEPRMIYGCFYGILKSNSGSLELLESLQKIYMEKCFYSSSGFDCFELIEACTCSTRKDFSAIDFMHEVLVPRLEERWNTSRFLHIDKYLLEFMVTLASVDYFEKGIWEKLLDNVRRKKFRDVGKWRRYYDLLHHFRKENFEEYSGISLDPLFERLEEFWKGNVDFQWKYSLEHQRYHTVEELIDKAKDTPNELTFEQAEAQIKHTLPKWYFEKVVDFEVSELYDEYKKSQTLKK